MENLVKNPVKVLIQHTNPLLAAGLTAVLRSGLLGFKVVTEAKGSPLVLDEPFDVVVTDLDGGLSLLAGAKSQVLPAVVAKARVLVVATAPKPAEVRHAVESGAYGFVVGQCTPDELCDAVQCLARGTRYFCKVAAQEMADSLFDEELTARQLDVLYLLTQGRANKVIARELGVTIGTVKSHIKHILGRLGVKSRMHAVSVAMQRGLVLHAPAVDAVQAPARPALRVLSHSTALPASANSSLGHTTCYPN